MNGVTGRRWLAAIWLVALSAPLLGVGVSAQPLQVRLDGDYLRVSAPQLQFLTGKQLDRLKDGLSVHFVGQLSLSTDANATIRARSIARFAVSYAIWEERFSIIQLEPVETPRRAASHLSAQAAQNWCLESLSINTIHIPAGKPFWIRLEFRAEDPRSPAGVLGEPGISITRLIEIFSRQAGGSQPHWLYDAGPLVMADLKRTG